MQKKIFLSEKYVIYNFIISIICLIIGILIVFYISNYFLWNIKTLFFVLLILIIFSVLECFHILLYKKNFYVLLKNDSILIHKGMLFSITNEIYFSKIYSIELKQNFISQKYNIYALSFRTVDMVFDVSGLSISDRNFISNYISERI